MNRKLARKLSDNIEFCQWNLCIRVNLAKEYMLGKISGIPELDPNALQIFAVVGFSNNTLTRFQCQSTEFWSDALCVLCCQMIRNMHRLKQLVFRCWMLVLSVSSLISYTFSVFISVGEAALYGVNFLIFRWLQVYYKCSDCKQGAVKVTSQW